MASLAAVLQHASADEKPVYAPPAPWVIPYRLRQDRTSPTATALKVLLLDQQVRLGSDSDDIFVESVNRIQTPQGLQAIGTIILPWNPEYETLTIHKLNIIRGSQVIDVLASGQTFTVLRRETNLENATLDGTLTAEIQPGGLQVGDTLDLSFTFSDANPVFKGISEWQLLADNPFPITRLRMRAQWSQSLPISWRPSDDMADVKETVRGGVHSILYSLDDAQPLVQINGAPSRYTRVRRIDATQFASWGSLSQHFSPLYTKAAMLSPQSTLVAEIAHIRRAFADPRDRASAALAFVQDKVRYVFLGLNLGGYVPAAADLTWARRFGDCKGKTVLLLAMLRGLGISADPVLVSTTQGDGLDKRLPVASDFDHVLVRASIGGDTYWLDGTRTGDRSISEIAVPAFHWGLPLTENGSELVPIKPQPFSFPLETDALRIDASHGLEVPAAIHAEADLRGDPATFVRMQLANASASQADMGLRQFWARRYNTLDIKSVSSRFDEVTGTERATMDGIAPKARDFLFTQTLVLGNERVLNFDRSQGPDQDAPFAVPFPFYVLKTEAIVLPDRGAGWTSQNGDVDQVIGGIAYRRTTRIEDGVFMGEASARAVAPEFPAADAAVTVKALRDLLQQAIVLRHRTRPGLH